jgi:hypothetical protein
MGSGVTVMWCCTKPMSATWLIDERQLLISSLAARAARRPLRGLLVYPRCHLRDSKFRGRTRPQIR